MQDIEKLYKWMLGYLLRRIVSCELDAETSNAIVITDTIPLNKKRKAVEKAIHKAVNRNQLPGIKYRILHHQSRSHYGLQVVDYCCWAIYRKWREGETRWYELIQSALRSEIDVFETQTECYY